MARIWAAPVWQFTLHSANALLTIVNMPYMPREDAFSLEDERALILDAQKNVISTAQALAVGMSPDALRAKTASGRWQQVYRGVYATFTGELSRDARLWAVALRCGRSA